MEFSEIYYLHGGEVAEAVEDSEDIGESDEDEEGEDREGEDEEEGVRR
jgi:hypothetical protein